MAKYIDVFRVATYFVVGAGVAFLCGMANVVVAQVGALQRGGLDEATRVHGALKGAAELLDRVRSVDVSVRQAQAMTKSEYGRIASGPEGYCVFVSPWVMRGADMRDSYVMASGEPFVRPKYAVHVALIDQARTSGVYNVLSPGSRAMRVSSRDGIMRSPVWDCSGKRIAYMNQRSVSNEWEVVVLDLLRGLETTYAALHMSEYNPNIFWDESGRYIGFIGSSYVFCQLDLVKNEVQDVVECQTIPQNIALSPNGELLCMLILDLDIHGGVSTPASYPDLIDAEVIEGVDMLPAVRLLQRAGSYMSNWSVQVVNIKNGKRMRIDQNRFGFQVLPPLLWTSDSRGVVLRVYSELSEGAWTPSRKVYWVSEDTISAFSPTNDTVRCQYVQF